MRGGQHGRAGRVVMVVMCVAVLLAGAVVLLLHFGGRGAVRSARAEVEAAVGSVDAIRARHPTLEGPNDAARELEALVAPLGISVAPKRRAVANRGTEDKARAERQDVMRQWLRQQRLRASDVVEPPSPDVSAELAASQGALDAVASALPRLADASWEVRLSQDGPYPNLAGLLHLERALLADGLDRHRTGAAGAPARLDAAWRVAQLLQRRPERLSQLIAVAMAGEIAAVARKMEGLDASWADRFTAEPFAAGMAEAYACDAVTALDAAELPGRRMVAMMGEGMAPWAAVVGAPVLRRVLADGARFEARAAQALRDPARCGKGSLPAPPPTARILGQGVPSAVDDGGAILRVDRLRLAFDLTRRVMELKTLRAADPGRAWPAEIPGGAPADCSGVRWEYRQPAPGIARIEASSWEGAWWEGGPTNEYPLEWESAP